MQFVEHEFQLLTGGPRVSPGMQERLAHLLAREHALRAMSARQVRRESRSSPSLRVKAAGVFSAGHGRVARRQYQAER